MTDLFARLAERALAACAPSLSAPPRPDPLLGEGEEPAGPEADVRAPAEGQHAAPRASAAPTSVASARAPAGPPAIVAAVPSIVPPPREPAAASAPRPAVEREPPTPPFADPAREGVRREMVLRERVSALERETARELVRERIRELAPVPPPSVPVVRHDQARSAAAPAAPPVEVRIGRVEVRVRPPAADPAPRTRAVPTAPVPALPLDEYLRSRETPA